MSEAPGTILEARNARSSLVERLRTELEGRPDAIVAVYLFGSVARGTARPDSDLDVGVLYEVDPPATLEGIPASLEADLSRAADRPVDLVVLNRAPVDLVHRVLRDGILVCEQNRSRRIAFEVRSRNAYWDLLPILRRYRRQEGARH